MEWAVAARTAPGAVASGDAYVVKTFAQGTLLAVVDGLGRGNQAATAAGIAVALLKPRGLISSIMLPACTW